MCDPWDVTLDMWPLKTNYTQTIDNIDNLISTSVISVTRKSLLCVKPLTCYNVLDMW